MSIASTYIQQHSVKKLLKEAVAALLREKPPNPKHFFRDFFTEEKVDDDSEGKAGLLGVEASIRCLTTTRERKGKLLDMWSTLDNGNGICLVNALQVFLATQYPLLNQRELIKKAMSLSCISEGFVQRDEFSGFLNTLALVATANQAFTRVDINGDGRLSRDEMIQGCKQMGLRLADWQAEELFDEAKGDDEHVSFQEFVFFFSQQAQGAASSMVDPLLEVRALQFDFRELTCDESRKMELLMIFKDLDVNQNGTIQQDEFSRNIEINFPPLHDEQAIRKAFALATTHGFAMLHELPTLLNVLVLLVSAKLIFSRNDLDSDQRLSRDEFRNALWGMGLLLADWQADEVFNANAGGDGQVDFQEFVSWVTADVASSTTVLSYEDFYGPSDPSSLRIFADFG